jgi:predicted ArsR family transcriptional regulator
MASLTQLFAERQIPISFERNEGLPVITVSGCPYPTLAKDNREICDMEKELLSKVIGQPINRCQCQQDGDQCCSFQAEQSQSGLEKVKAK